MMIKCIEIEVNGTLIKLTLDEAKILKTELDQLFPASTTVTSPMIPLPYTPTRQPAWWDGAGYRLTAKPGTVRTEELRCGDPATPSTTTMFKAQHSDVRVTAADLSRDDGTEHY